MPCICWSDKAFKSNPSGQDFANSVRSAFMKREPFATSESTTPFDFIMLRTVCGSDTVTTD